VSSEIERSEDRGCDGAEVLGLAAGESEVSPEEVKAAIGKVASYCDERRTYFSISSDGMWFNLKR
jgi:hypothetical protein